MKTGVSLSSTQLIAPQRRLFQVGRTQHALHIDLIYAPVESASIDRTENDSPKRIDGVCVRSMEVHCLRDLCQQFMPPADFMQSDEQHERAPDYLDRALNDVGISHSGETTHHGKDGRDGAQNGNGEHDIPAQEVLEYHGTCVKTERHLGHHANDQHQPGKEDPGECAVPHFQEFRDGEDAVVDVERKEYGCGETQADRGGQLYRARTKTIAIGVAG